VTTDTKPVPAEVLEATVHRLMTAKRAIPDRGWDSARRRAEIQAAIDHALDRYNEATS
jgi:hypothetical protein